MDNLELLQARLTEVSASLAQARGPVKLAQILSLYVSPGLTLEDHPWLRAAAAHLPALPAFAGSSSPETMETLVSVGLGAIPETGSVLISSRSPQAFRLSLAPRRHIVVIPAEQAALTLADALELTSREPSGLISWLTGPSRTADIEKVLVLGAQGTSELLVVVYQEE